MTKLLMIFVLTVFSVGVFADPAPATGEQASTGDSVDERCNTGVVNGDGQESDGSSTPAPATATPAGAQQ